MPGADDEESSPPRPHHLGGGNDKEEDGESRQRKKRKTATSVQYKETDDDEEQAEQTEDNRKWLRQQQKKKQRMLQAREFVATATTKNNNNNVPPHHPVGGANPVVPPPLVAYTHPHGHIAPRPTVSNIPPGNPRPTLPNPIHNPHVNPGTAGGRRDMPRPSEPLQKALPLVVATNDNALPPPPNVSASTDNRQIKVQIQTLQKKKNRYTVKVNFFDNTTAASTNMGISAEIIEAVCQEGGGFLKGSWIGFYNPKVLDIKTIEFFLAIPAFDVTRLCVLPAEEVGKQWWKRVIELVCKRSQEPMVCFPSIRHACAALVLEPPQVQRACHTYGTQEQYDFRGYMLRYKIKSTAYVYGSHEPDFRQVQESTAERIARWKVLMTENSKSAGGTKTPAPTVKTTPAPTSKNAGGTKTPTPTVKTTPAPTSKNAGGTKALTPIAAKTTPAPIPVPVPIKAPERPKAVYRESEDTDTDESWSRSVSKKKKKKEKKKKPASSPAPTRAQPPKQKKKEKDAWKESGATKNYERDATYSVAVSNAVAKWKESQIMNQQKKPKEPIESLQECEEWMGSEDAEYVEPEMIPRAAEPQRIPRAAEPYMIPKAAEQQKIPRAAEPLMILREIPRRHVPILPIQRPGSPRRDNILTETLGLFSNAFTERPERHPNRKCIFCQDTPAEIVFEPCGHSVVCKKCATWACSKYCPKCNADIATRKLGITIFRDVKVDLTCRPQTFSPYQFMDL
jgi:hypothetical protein